MINNPYDQYKQQGVLTASPTELVVMLYEGCIKQLKLSKIFIEEKNYEGANNAIKKAEDIVTELVMGLDFNYEMARDLLNIYEFVQRSLLELNATKDPEKIEPIIGILEDLRSAWVEVAKKNRVSSFGLEDG